MRMSCNGCRALRKGCSEDCTIRPCLQWITNPQSQANATLFLAKFYGRAGLLNLINAGPEHLRPAVFRSLLYEACGRIVNPIYGSVGLLWSGSWNLCQSAVEAVLIGLPIVQAASELAASQGPPLKPHDIRHVSKKNLHRVRTRSGFKRVGKKPKAHLLESSPDCGPDELARGPSHDSSTSHRDESESAFSVETVEASLLSRAESEPDRDSRADEIDLDLGLALGFGARVMDNHVSGR